MRTPPVLLLFLLATAISHAADYRRVTDARQLSHQSRIIIVNTEYRWALSTTQETNNRGRQIVNINNNLIENVDEKKVQVITLEGTPSSCYLSTPEGYLSTTSSTTANILRTTSQNTYSQATITLDEDGNAIITFVGKSVRNQLQYSSSGGVFSCYDAGKQKAVQIYKLDDNSVQPPTAIGFSPPAGTYQEEIDVTLTADHDAQIYYTVDGSEPTTSSSLYEQPVHLAENTTIKALATNEGGWTMASADYQINLPPVVVEKPTVDLPSGTYYGRQTAHITPAVSTSFAYTTDGSSPSAQTMHYNSEIDVDVTKTMKLRVVAFDDKGNYSAEVVRDYSILVHTPQITPASTTFSEPFECRMDCQQDDVEIHYTLDGHEPDASSQIYTGPFLISTEDDVVVKALATDAYGNSSDVVTATYTYVPGIPKVENIAAFKQTRDDGEYLLQLNDADVFFVKGNNVFIHDDTGGLCLFKTGLEFDFGWRLNGEIAGRLTEFGGLDQLAATANTSTSEFSHSLTTPTPFRLSIEDCQSERYVCEYVELKNVLVTRRGSDYLVFDDSGEMVLRDAFSVVSSLSHDSLRCIVRGTIAREEGHYLFMPLTDWTCGPSKPEFSVAEGVYPAPFTVTIACEEGAEVFYTDDGTMPSRNSKRYVEGEGIVVGEGETTLRAMAVMNDMESEIATATYMVVVPTCTLSEAKTKAVGSSLRLSVDNTQVVAVLTHTDYEEGIYHHELFLRDDNTSGSLTIDSPRQHPLWESGDSVGGAVDCIVVDDWGRLRVVAGGYDSMVKVSAGNAVSPCAVDNAAELASSVFNYVALTDCRVLDSDGGVAIVVDDRQVVMDDVLRRGAAQPMPYDGAWVDVTGMLLPGDDGLVLSPVVLADDIRSPFVYVLDQDREDNVDIMDDTERPDCRVRMRRTLLEGLNTLCLPFDLDALMMDSMGMKCWIFDDVCRDDDGVAWLVFEESTRVPAGCPMIVDCEHELVDPVFDGVALARPANERMVSHEADGSFTMQGIFSKTEVKGADRRILNSSGTALTTPTGGNLKGYRAFFVVPTGVDARLSFGAPDIEGLEMVRLKSNVSPAYNILGQRLADGKGRGLVIVDGRKRVVK